MDWGAAPPSLRPTLWVLIGYLSREPMWAPYLGNPPYRGPVGAPLPPHRDGCEEVGGEVSCEAGGCHNLSTISPPTSCDSHLWLSWVGRFPNHRLMVVAQPKMPKGAPLWTTRVVPITTF